MAFNYPVPSAITQYFGANPNSYQPNGHFGVDFACNLGDPIYSIGAGTVVWADWGEKMGANPWQMIPGSPASGIVVLIDHGAITSMYAHLSATHLNVGQKVIAGQQIGKAGTTGRSTGVHLHLETLVDANMGGWMFGRVDPLSLMNRLLPIGEQPLAGNQRKVGPSNLNQRARPVSNATVVRIVPANTVETFTGYVVGEKVTVGGVTSNIWYKDAKGYVWAGGFTSQATTGLANLTPVAPLAPNQRKVKGANANMRKEPKTTAPVVRLIQANTVETFTGFVRGENFSGNNIWFKDAVGYVWSGLFYDTSTTGLRDLTPAPAPAPAPAPVIPPSTPLPVYATKTLVQSPVNFRRQPVLDPANILGQLNAGAKVSISGWGDGQIHGGSSVWLQVAPGNGWIHSSMVTDASLTAIPRIDVSIPTNPMGYSFTPDFDFVEYLPAHTSNMQDGNFPADQHNVVIHQFDAKAKNPSIEGVINHFRTVRPGNESSAHFVVSGKRIVQMVSLKDRAFHAGTTGNSYVGIEVDPDQDADTIASVKKLLTALKAKYGRELTRHLHKNVPGNSTLCGAEINLDSYKLDPVVSKPPVIVTPTPTPTPVPVPAPSPTPVNEEEIIADFLDWLIKSYLDQK